MNNSRLKLLWQVSKIYNLPITDERIRGMNYPQMVFTIHSAAEDQQVLERSLKSSSPHSLQ
jgi:hypothetical protein